ncbi:HIG1 domain family member 1A, mitochondrial-like [Amphiura filiformis]|uniref:HIG1 domain family member 1A, mitochondrial-like n=1 Tax=Amphiura filiformis TaxID=82378 RepID=UPI003B2190FC
MAADKTQNTAHIVDYGQFDEDESGTEKFWRKAINEPFVPAGILGTCGVLAWGAYRFKHRAGTKPSIFLLQLRVMSQSMIVGAMVIGALSHMYKYKADQAAKAQGAKK